jgi:hypothetical protein
MLLSQLSNPNIPITDGIVVVLETQWKRVWPLFIRRPLGLHGGAAKFHIVLH